MLKIAREKAKREGLDIEFCNMDVCNLNFNDEYFDGAFSIAAFEFIKHPDKAIEEMFRVVKKGGLVMIGTINKDSKWGELYLSEEYQKRSIFKHADFKTINDLKKLKSDYLVHTSECLFILPGTKKEHISMEMELELSKTGRDGFICALWEK